MASWQQVPHGGSPHRPHLTEYGDPDAPELMVCLHGLGGSALNFGLVAPLLAEGRRVLVPDLLSHGRSFATAPGESAVEAQLQMVSQLLARETERPVILVGHSMGGILAMLHALRLPESVKSLVLLDPPVPSVTRWTCDPRLVTKLVLLQMPGVAALVARQVAHMTPEQLVARQLTAATPHLDRIPAAVVDATVKETTATRGKDGGRSAQRGQFRAILEVVELLARPARWRMQLAEITAPTLWLHGADDPLSPRGCSVRWPQLALGGRSGPARGSGTCPTSRTPRGQHDQSPGGWGTGDPSESTELTLRGQIRSPYRGAVRRDPFSGWFRRRRPPQARS